jgi:hypothetical protein
LLARRYQKESAVVALWKVKREALRVWFQFADKITEPYDRFHQRRYDANFTTVTKLIDGKVEPSEKIALFFIFQDEDFSKSILVTCEYLFKKGFSVLVVSSGEIAKREIEKLLPFCWKILIRPNYGYDFGGYRDGLRFIAECNLEPERLVILNDSIWFPTYQTTRLVEKLEDANLPFNSPVFINIADRSIENRHFQSFFFLLQKDALESEAFINYWKHYRVSSIKRIVLKLGEKGFSQAMFKGGFGGDAPATKSVLFDLIGKQSNDFIYKTLNYAAYAEQPMVDDARSIMATFGDTEVWRKRALAHIQDALSKSSPIGVFVYASTLLLDFSFLKKRSFADVFDGMRWQYLRAVKNGDLPAPHPDILAEIMASKMDGRLTTDPSIPAPVSATKVR